MNIYYTNIHIKIFNTDILYTNIHIKLFMYTAAGYADSFKYIVLLPD